MYVAIKTTVIDRIRGRIEAIRRQNREPEYVVVSHEEYAELCEDRRRYSYLSFDSMRYDAKVPLTATIKTYEFTAPNSGHAYGHDVICTYSREKFMDLPLLVVPARFVPR